MGHLNFGCRQNKLNILNMYEHLSTSLNEYY